MRVGAYYRQGSRMVAIKLTISSFYARASQRLCSGQPAHRMLRKLSQTKLPGWLVRLLTAYSVRTRIVVLALIPVVGFFANGVTYMAGERDVGTAFDTVRRSNALADASRDFKSAIATMRITLKDFTATPSEQL